MSLMTLIMHDKILIVPYMAASHNAGVHGVQITSDTYIPGGRLKRARSSAPLVPPSLSRAYTLLDGMRHCSWRRGAFIAEDAYPVTPT